MSLPAKMPKIQLHPVRVADFTSKIGQDIKGMKIALPKEYLGEGIDPEVKETILMLLNTLKNWEQLSKKSAFHTLNTGLPFTISSLLQKLLQTCNVSMGFVMVSVRKMPRTWMTSMNTRSQGFGDEVKRRIMLGTFSLSSGYYDAYYKKAGQVRTSLSKTSKKVFADYDLILGPTAPSVAFDLDSLNHDPVAMYLWTC